MGIFNQTQNVKPFDAVAESIFFLHSFVRLQKRVEEVELMILWSLSVCLSPTENQECLQHVVNERLGELVRVLKTVIGKHQALNSSEILGAAGTVIAKVKGEHPPSAPPHFRINNLELVLSLKKVQCLCMYK